MTLRMISASSAGVGLDHTGRVEVGERLVAIAPRLVAGVVARTEALEDGDRLGDLVPRRVGMVERLEALAIGGAGALERVDDRQRLLVPREVRRLLAGRLLLAPDAEQVVVELERETERPAEAAVALDDRLVVGGEAARPPRSRPR